MDADVNSDFKKNPVVFCKDKYTLFKVLDTLDPEMRKYFHVPGVYGTDIYLKELHDKEFIKIEDFEDSVLIESKETNTYIQIYDKSGSGEFPIDNYTEIKFNASNKLEALRQGYLAGIGLFDPEVSFEEVINDLQIDGMINDYDYEKLITANEVEL